METRPSGYGWGYLSELKLRLRLLKCPAAIPNSGWTVTLLDKNGFRITDAHLYKFYQVAGTELLEGQATESAVSEVDYRRAVDYTVTP